MSMATRSSDLENQKSGLNVQTEGHTLTPPSSQNGPIETEAFSSAPIHSPSSSPVRRKTTNHPGTQYYSEIQVISIEDGKTTPLPSHAWQAPVVEDILWVGKLGLTKSIMIGPSQAILSYGRQRLGDGLSLGEVCDDTFMLTSDISWVGKQAQLDVNAVTL